MPDMNTSNASRRKLSAAESALLLVVGSAVVAFLAWPSEPSSGQASQTPPSARAMAIDKPQSDAALAGKTGSADSSADALTPEQKLNNVQDYFGGVFSSIKLASEWHDAVLRRIQMDMRAGELADARAYAHKLIDDIENSQANVAGTAVNLEANGDLPPDVIDDVFSTSNAVFADFADSAAGIASMVDFGTGENASDMKDLQGHLKHLRALMFSVYRTYGYAPEQVDSDTWRLKAKPVSPTASAPAPSNVSR